VGKFEAKKMGTEVPIQSFCFLKWLCRN